MRFQNRFLIALSAALLLTAVPYGVRADLLPLTITSDGATAVLPLPHEVSLVFPGEGNFFLQAPHATNWLDGMALHVTLVWPGDAPAHSGSLAWLKDRDDFWHQYVCPDFLRPGVTNTLTIPFQPGATGWQTPGHSLAWHHRVRLNPQSVGIRVFSDTPYTGRCVLVSAMLETREDRAPPIISKVRPVTRSAKARELYEIRFDLPDRYANPFDPTQIDAGARISGPDGTTHTVFAFYYIPHYRLEDELGEPVEPDGPPEWRIRYCPLAPGDYTVSLYARDAQGEALATDVLRFTAAAAADNALHFVRVSTKDPRYFEFDDGSLFYPIGHNVRSATDSRMDDKFPWVFRKEEGTTAYRRYFKRMQDAGENFAEVWMSSWSLGLEWREGIGGYHGANDFHMGNAWELDRVMELARQHRIYLNLVLNYHGRISTWCDPEWQLHPYNKVTPGGWLTMPLEFFSDPRAIEMQKRFCRYTGARWGWAPMILGYELCSEINLTGHETHHRSNFLPEVVAWCRAIGAYIKATDPYHHLVSAHISNDFNFLNPDMCKSPELDFLPLDAYHHTQPERIIALAASTADAGAIYNKPILITEFGGSPMAAGREHLMIEQHAALWSGACVSLAGIPMFWWWQVVDENNLYGRYTAVKRFLENLDPRDTTAKRVPVSLTLADGGDTSLIKTYDALCTASPDKARGYIYPKRFARAGQSVSETRALNLNIDGFTPGLFRVEFFDTETGKPVRRFDVRTQANLLAIPVPPFRSDCAFRLSLLTPLSKK